MSKIKSCLEDLPNELLTDIFKYLDAHNLFRACFNLNIRFNRIIQSFEYLKLYLHIYQPNLLKSNEDNLSYYVHTLIVNSWISFNLQHFPNVRRLKLDCPIPYVLEQLKPHTMPHLKHLSISYNFTMFEMEILLTRIFSNQFFNLKTCELLNSTDLMTIKTYSQSPTIQYLKVKFIDSIIYQTILSACPNLFFFQFSLLTKTSFFLQNPFHSHLKQMIISLPKSDWFDGDNQILHQILFAVPNLQKLTLDRLCLFEELIDYDWLSTIIQAHLLKLRRLKYFIRYISSEDVNTTFLQQIHRDFIHLHQGEYVARLILNRESL